MSMSTTLPIVFNADSILSYLGLPSDYSPSPSGGPVEFLSIHLRELPPNLLAQFSLLLTPQQRSVLPAIRNRRQKYAFSIPKELSFDEARKRWPLLWEGRDRPGVQQAKEEKTWAEREFLGGQKGRIGKLGQLLGGYEEEREAERFREARHGGLAQKLSRQSLDEEPEVEEEEEEEEDDDQDQNGPLIEEEDTPDQLRINFERLIRERFIYGLLDNADYEVVDWEDRWDELNEQDSEERWFDEEEENGAPPMSMSLDLDLPSRSAV
ncbi:hypothetical protein Clacol_001261 [Clathrus columnatus]|uniref:CCD97-like C-terminal domain-containing protein n=1 Tax=Clathrus columnatus TaxID=1419009 RepID=A0AAV5A0X1_9AGAM|nr:hypothetical protein Clacol_001261 [Clathrus columnatus]